MKTLKSMSNIHEKLEMQQLLQWLHWIHSLFSVYVLRLKKPNPFSMPFRAIMMQNNLLRSPLSSVRRAADHYRI